MNEQTYNYTKRGTVVIVFGLLALLLISFAMAGGCRSYNRYQKRADAKNAIRVTHTKISVAKQQAQINRAQIAATKADAEKRYQESIGIRRAQDQISQTLTPLYVQHEAIQAQKAAADSPNHTQVYIPSGNQGVPLVKPVP